jgi:hypothetical protein
MHPREMIAEILENGQLDWLRFLVVEEEDDVILPLSTRRLDSTRRPTDLAWPEPTLRQRNRGHGCRREPLST